MTIEKRLWIDPSNIVYNAEVVDTDNLQPPPDFGEGWHYVVVLSDSNGGPGMKWNGDEENPTFTQPNRLVNVDPSTNLVAGSYETTNTEAPPDELFLLIPNDGNDVAGLYWNGDRDAPQFADTPYT